MADLLTRKLLIAITAILVAAAGMGFSAPGVDNYLFDTAGEKQSEDGPPQMFISVGPPTGNHGWYNKPVSLKVESQGSGSKIREESISIGGGAWYSRSLTINKDGKFIVYGQAVDGKGRVSSAWVKVNLDMTPPKANLTLPEPGGKSGWYVGSVPVLLDGVDNLSGVYETSLSIEKYSHYGETGSTQVGKAIKTENVAIDSVRALLEESGSYRLTGYVEDIAGNRRQIDQTINIDLVPPAAEIHAPRKFYGKITLTGSIEDANSGVRRLFLDVGDGWEPVLFTTHGKWTVEWSTEGLKDGEHLIKARVEDAAGNQTFTYYKATVLNTTWPFLAFSGVLVSMAVIAAGDPRRKAWQELSLALAKVSHMEKSAMFLKRQIK